MSFYKKIGGLLLGTRLKRLGDRFIQDMSLIYKTLDIEFEAAWFPFVFLLHSQGKTSLTNMATDLEISHSAVSQMTALLEKKNFVRIDASSEDGRKKVILLTPYGENCVKKLIPIWNTIEDCIDKVLKKTQQKDLLIGLSVIESELATGQISGKVIKTLNEKNKINVCEFKVLSNEEIQFINNAFLIDSSKLKSEFYVGKFGHQIEAIALANTKGSVMEIFFQQIESNNNSKNIAEALLKKILQNKSKNIMIEATDPPNDFLKTMVNSGYSFKVNRTK